MAKYPSIEHHAVCCGEAQAESMINLANRIKLTPPYNTLSDRDLYVTLIFIYYALLGEQRTDIFNMNFLSNHASNKELVVKLYIDLTTGDIIETSGKNLSQDVRRGFLGFSPKGGNKHNKSRRRKGRKKKGKKGKKGKTKRRTHKRRI